MFIEIGLEQAPIVFLFCFFSGKKTTLAFNRDMYSHLALCLQMILIEIGLEHTPFVVLVYFFPHLNMQNTS